MKIEFIKDGKQVIAKIKISEDTYIEKVLSKQETLGLFNNLKNIIYS